MNTLLLTQKKEDIALAGQLIRDGEVVAMPTETVYGLAANALDGNAVKKIFEAKGRPQDNPLIVHIADIKELYNLAKEVPPGALALAEKYWPGPLTVILPKADCIPDEVSAGLSTVAVRMPSHPAAAALIREAGVPLAAPSANISGFPSPTACRYVCDDMNGRIAAIIDGGDCGYGIESTVVTLAGGTPRLLRPGAVTLEMLKSVLGEVEVDPAVLNPLAKGAVAASPGMKYKHYSPNAKISVVKGGAEDFVSFAEKYPFLYDGVLCFEGEEKYFVKPYVTMGKSDDSLSQAQRLFDALRELDEKELGFVIARAPSEEGVGLGVCNRLYRAAGFSFFDTAAKGKITGISGGTGSGKSTVARELSNDNTVIVDADKTAREVTKKGSPVLKRLAGAFGDDIILADGELDRALLAKRAFSSDEKTKLLTDITNPEIIKICGRLCLGLKNEGRNVLLDAPLLFGSGLNGICDETVFVYAPEETRIKRIMKRDGITEQQARERAARQKNELELAHSLADRIIDNSEEKAL